jgi:hypothetical protein
MLADAEVIRAVAHRIWETEGQPDGRALDHWLTAQRQTAIPEVTMPWYDARSMVNEADWMRRMLWHPQPYLC